MGRATPNRPRINHPNAGVSEPQFMRDGAAYDAGADDQYVHGSILVG